MSEDLKERIEKRVEAGALWLDSVLPEWWETHGINLTRFQMSDGCLCVIGQLYAEVDEFDGDEDESPFEQALDSSWLDLDARSAVAYGFYASLGASVDLVDEYEALQAEWVRVITERRAAA